MKHFSFNLTSKYTASLLDLFNDIQILYPQSDGGVKYITIPIKFRSKERAVTLSETETNELITGNTSIIPRLSLTLENITKVPERTTNKYRKSHQIEFENGIKYTMNSIGYNWNFNLILIARTMSETSQFIEQIAPMFRPTYTMNINEIPILKEPTTVPLEMQDFDIDIQDDHEDENVRFIVTTVPLVLRGNMYLPIQEQNVIELMKVYINNWFIDSAEFEKSILIEETGNAETGEKEPQKITDLRPVIDTKNPIMVPVIQDIVMYPDKNTILECHENQIIELMGLVNDIDNEGNELTYVWTTNNGVISSGNYKVQFKPNQIGTADVTLTVIDYHGNQSLSYTKQVNVI